jgi:hypothetical protein
VINMTEPLVTLHMVERAWEFDLGSLCEVGSRTYEVVGVGGDTLVLRRLGFWQSLWLRWRKWRWMRRRIRR